ncbi:MAG TPA: hypothetical protein DIC52_07265 [Candidatus Latescibacteria bacterium]|jgi:hypothetical protein|nr:hypothetical protein [Candidatus Latescibacterota bacterium]
MKSLRCRDNWLQKGEFMDHPAAAAGEVEDAELTRTLLELSFVHRWFGGRRGTWAGLDLVRGNLGSGFSLLDVGSGGGDLAHVVADWSCKNGLRSRTMLMDFSHAICLESRTMLSSKSTVLQSDAQFLPFREKCIDIVHFGLFLHHFSTEVAAHILTQAHAIARRAVIVNDLHRHAVPYLATRAGIHLSRSEMVRHDAPISVGRGFRRADLQEIAGHAGFRWNHLLRVWPYRWVAVKIVGSS